MQIDSYKETFETWDKVATFYQDKFMDLDFYNESYDFFCNLLVEEKSKIFELGCGPGNITKYLLSKRPDLNIFATDISPNMIELAKKNNPTASFAILDSRELEKIKTKFDALICGFCIPYLSHKDCEKLIFNVPNVLNQTGLVYISFVEGNAIKSGFKKCSTGDRTYFYYHTFDSLKIILTTNNFELLKRFKIKYKSSDNEIEFHTVIIAKRQ